MIETNTPNPINTGVKRAQMKEKNEREIASQNFTALVD